MHRKYAAFYLGQLLMERVLFIVKLVKNTVVRATLTWHNFTVSIALIVTSTS